MFTVKRGVGVGVFDGDDDIRGVGVLVGATVGVYGVFGVGVFVTLGFVLLVGVGVSGFLVFVGVLVGVFVGFGGAACWLMFSRHFLLSLCTNSTYVLLAEPEFDLTVKVYDVPERLFTVIQEQLHALGMLGVELAPVRVTLIVCEPFVRLLTDFVSVIGILIS